MQAIATLTLGALVLAASGALALDEDAIRRCVSIETAAERLACYDEIGRALTGDPEQNFGKPKQVVEPVMPPQIESTVTLVEHDSAGAAYLHLANGQLWRISEANNIRLQRGEPQSVLVEKASLGSYLLQIGGHGRKWRAKRVQ